MVTIDSQVPELSFEYFQKESFKNAKLTDFRGKWLVLLFYPADFSFVCPTELGEAAKKYSDFKKLGTEIISFSTDTVYTHKAWHDASQIVKTVNFPMAADPAGFVCSEFGTYIQSKGVSLRGTFIIDPDGLVKSIEIHENSIGRSIDEIYRKLEAAIYVRENKSEVCPASWRPGLKTLKPGVDLVGKI